MVIINSLRWEVMAFFCMIMASTIISADELSLNQAVELAIKNNPTIASGQFSADAAKQAVRGARALTNPEISISPNMIGDAGADSAVFFSQPLEINGTRRVRGEIAAYQATVASFDAALIRRDIVLFVKQTYWDVARAQELVELNQDNLVYLKTFQAVVQKQNDVGTVPGSQVLKTDVELAKARQELSLAQLELAQAKATMNTLLNRSENQDFTIADSLVFFDTAVDRELFKNIALTKRPEVASAQAQVEVAQRQIKSAQLKYMPDLAIQARRETFNAGSDSGVALVVTLPLLDWGSAKADRKQAESVARSQDKMFEATRNKISLDVGLAVQLVETSSQIVSEYQGDILAKSEELAQMARIGYEKGATSYLEVLEAQRTLRSTRTAYFTALANSFKSLAQLEWAIGCEVPGGTISEVKK